jgi:hypothetical protein
MPISFLNLPKKSRHENGMEGNAKSSIFFSVTKLIYFMMFCSVKQNKSHFGADKVNKIKNPSTYHISLYTELIKVFVAMVRS